MNIEVSTQYDKLSSNWNFLNVIPIEWPEMGLLRHFDKMTSKSLSCGRMFWREVIVTVAFQVSDYISSLARFSDASCWFIYTTSYP